MLPTTHDQSRPLFISFQEIGPVATKDEELIPANQVDPCIFPVGQWRTRDFEKEGARNFRKFERNIDQNLKLSHSNFVPFFAQNQVKSKKKKSSLKFRPIFCPKSSEEQKKGLHSNFVPFFAQNQVISSQKPDAQLAKGGPCLNFAHFSMQFCNPGDPKGVYGPPLNSPLL